MGRVKGAVGRFGEQLAARHLEAAGLVPAKAARLRRLALRWLAARGVGWRDLRFDVVTVLRRPDGDPVVRHLRGAF